MILDKFSSILILKLKEANMRNYPSIFRTNLFPSNLFEEFSQDLSWQEKEGIFEASFDMPGVKKEDVQVRVDRGIVLINGERKDKFSQRTYNFSTSLPQQAKDENIEAEYINGVLYLRVKKSESKENVIVVK